ncbi:sulfate ABC transporter permease subunit [Nocardioides sp. ChNu-153]|uniref:sulfate ABC transporter permease n=1 Tax=unclassified Nocardioides TaxID=2615069 RepID=UPI002406A8EB|nr:MULTISPECIES: sulfate ABC transporter permease subunit [unclassified Nocardioides]MDN7119784.1 sulfate ABC transporter permease subunit [Nocardioides sp. ChNu-153]
MAESTLTRRGRRGPLTYVLRVLVLVYLLLLVAWPVSLIAQRALLPVDDPGGLGPFLERLTEPSTVYAFNLTLTVAFWAVLANTVFGVSISLLLVRYRFWGRRALSVLVDLPLSVSPVVVGLALVLAYSSTRGWFGDALGSVGVQVVFSTPGLVLATAFVSLPLVVREVVPVLEEIGTDAEQAARSLGANGRQTFWRITLPSIKWAVLYGVVLTAARSLGEFGAVKIVSQGAEFNGETATLLVQNEYGAFNEPAAYAVALVLVLISIIALVVVTYLRPKEDRA